MYVKSNLEEILLQLTKSEKARTSSDVSRQYYVDLHKDRFADILRLCQSYVGNPSARVLDVGRSEFTAHLLILYSNVSTLGIDLCTDDGGHREGAPWRQYHILNLTYRIRIELINGRKVVFLI